MKQFIASLASVTPYFQSRNYNREILKNEGEGADAYEERTWRWRTHVDETGQIIIPGNALIKSIQQAGRLLGKIPGQRNATWTTPFATGLIATADIVLPERRESVTGAWLFLNADGKSGGRVWRCMPYIMQWRGDLPITVLDDRITDAVLADGITKAGLLVGVGQNRPQNRGDKGRFRLTELIEV